ncbi:MAG: hypothetical protein ACI4HN_02530 [Ruminococcus sp.]
MKKRTKILSIMLALMLTATLVPTALVQVFASDDDWQDPATQDEITNSDFYYSMLLKKAPDHTFTSPCDTTLSGADALKGENKSNSIACNMFGAELLFYHTSGDNTTISINESCTKYEFLKNGYYATYDLNNGYLIMVEDLGDYKAKIKLMKGVMFGTGETLFSGEFDLNNAYEPNDTSNPYTNIEISKAPTKTFSAPCFNKMSSNEEELAKIREMAERPENKANSIACNMDGAEITLYLKNGEKEIYYLKNCLKSKYSGVPVEKGGDGFAYVARYMLFPIEFKEQAGVGIGGDEALYLTVGDLGNYSIQLSVENWADYVYISNKLTINYSGSGNNQNSNNETKTENTVPTSSGNGTSSTSDTPANGNISSNNTSNGTVATGNAAVSAILLSVLLSAAGVMAVIGRKKLLF